MEIDLAWLPSYQVRKSPKAKHVHLKVSPEKGLEVVIPYRSGFVDIEELLLKNRNWIEKKLSQIVIPTEDASLPEQLDLRAIAETWYVQTLPSSGKLRLLARPGNSLVLYGDVSDLPACKQKLKAWVKKKAKNHLVPWTRSLSTYTELMVNDVSVRSQKTRWGSCSPEANISLNHKLIFLPYHLARYVIVHELCHIKHLNHSKRFWKLVEKFDPDYLAHRRELNHLSLSLGDLGFAGKSLTSTKS